MANTWSKLPLRVIAPSNSYLSLFERDTPEAASQTFPVGSPIKNSSGLAAVWVSPTDGDIIGFALTAGQNGTGKTTKYLPATEDLEIEANFLGSAAADNVLAAGDLFLTRDLVSSSTLLPKAPQAGWYIADTSSDVAVQIIAFKSDNPISNVLESNPAAGDTNARVRAKVIPGVSAWY